MDIAVDFSLVYYSFICLGNDCDEIIEQNNDHKHSLEEPNSPDETHHKITRRLTNFSRLSLKEPRVIIWGCEVSNGVSKGIEHES